MKLFTDWGFSAESWQGQRGEYWVLAQVVLVLGFLALPVYRGELPLPQPPEIYWIWGLAAVGGLVAAVLLGKGLLDLGRNLTPLPYPKPDGELVQTGVYGSVRHPLYGGLTIAAFSWALYLISLSHLVGAIAFFLFFNAKASREEVWLSQKYPAYQDYQKRAKRLIPWVY